VTFAASSKKPGAIPCGEKTIPANSHPMAIGIASADSFDGPWIAGAEPIRQQGDGSIGGCGDTKSGRIDPSIVRGPNGNLYIYYIYQPDRIHVAELAANGLTILPGTDHEVSLVGGKAFGPTEAWEETTIEGVEAHVKNGVFYLLYSGASTWDGTYAVGVARSQFPDKEFEKHGAPILSSTSKDKLQGPGHSSQWVDGPNGDTYLLYHVQFAKEVAEELSEEKTDPQHRYHLARYLCLDELTFDATGWPRVGQGSPTEAEQKTP
jgi:beta-xylosidase